jgi:Rieske Fe-S protein
MPCKATTRRDFLIGSGCGVISMAACGLAIEAALPVTIAAGAREGTERTYPLPAADGVSIDRDAQVILVRFEHKVFAMALACPHENAAVKWLSKDRRFQCTKHDSRYTPQGTYTSGRATRNLDRFPVRRSGASIVVGIDRVHRSDQDPNGWDAAFVEVSG